MNKGLIATLFFLTGLSQLSYAQAEPPPVNQIQMQLTLEQWAKTLTAKVIVNVAAMLNQGGLATTQRTINTKLNRISDKAEWHITNFNRYKDSSGLERVNISAEARLPESELPTLRSRAEKISKPGEKFTIGSVDFSPSLADVERTKQELREKMYQQIHAELARVNKNYGEQKFFVHGVNFIPGVQPVPMQKMQARMYTTAEAAPSSSALTISDKVVVTAVVTFGELAK